MKKLFGMMLLAIVGIMPRVFADDLAGTYVIDEKDSFYYDESIPSFKDPFSDVPVLAQYDSNTTYLEHLDNNADKVHLKGTFDFYEEPFIVFGYTWFTYAPIENANLSADTPTQYEFRLPEFYIYYDGDGLYYPGAYDPYTSRLEILGTLNIDGDIHNHEVVIQGVAPIDAKDAYAFTLTADQVAVVPEPPTLALFALGAACAFIRRRARV